MGKRRAACRVSEEKPEGKRTLRTPGSRWKYNIKMNIQKVGWEGRGHRLDCSGSE
jgi:hypothetical protein